MKAAAWRCGSPIPNSLQWTAPRSEILGRASRATHARLQLDDPSAEQRAQAQVHADALIWEADGRP